MTLDDLFQFKHIEIGKPRDLNFRNIPITRFDMNTEGAIQFNEVYFFAKNFEGLHRTWRTPSGGICVDGWKFYQNLYSWDVIQGRACIDLTIIMEACAWRFQFRSGAIKDPVDERGERTCGAQAFAAFCNHLNEHGIDIWDYAITNGEEVKKTIESPMIRMADDSYCNIVIKNANHLDFHSSYPAGLVNTHPEFREAVEVLYQGRKKRKIYKNILNFTIGYMQSTMPQVKARWAHLSKDAIEDNNKRVREMAQRLKRNKRLVLAFNTDGIWYQGKPYTGKGRGNKLGEWNNDHTDCTIRFKSAGCYEYIEKGKYTPVVRGFTKLDYVKPRDEWEFGDIYNDVAEVIRYTFNADKGIMENGKEL